jgi:hypothetical protein
MRRIRSRCCPTSFLRKTLPQPRQCSNKREGWDVLVHDALFH